MAKGTGSGFKIVNGYKFPEDATDEEIAKALGLLQDPNAPKLSETPESQRPQTLRFKNIWAGPEGLFGGKSHARRRGERGRVPVGGVHG